YAGHVYCTQGTIRACRTVRKKPLHRKTTWEKSMGEENDCRPLCPHLTVAHATLEPQPNLSKNKPIYERESWNARVVWVAAEMRASADL
ncbi:hypothetical protein SCHPADRAFT_904399, partial [Schizopora paradoxa]